jgi:hypothetical protein
LTPPTPGQIAMQTTEQPPERYNSPLQSSAHGRTASKPVAPQASVRTPMIGNRGTISNQMAQTAPVSPPVNRTATLRSTPSVPPSDNVKLKEPPRGEDNVTSTPSQRTTVKLEAPLTHSMIHTSKIVPAESPPVKAIMQTAVLNDSFRSGTIVEGNKSPVSTIVSNPPPESVQPKTSTTSVEVAKDSRCNVNDDCSDRNRQKR